MCILAGGMAARTLTRMVSMAPTSVFLLCCLSVVLVRMRPPPPKDVPLSCESWRVRAGAALPASQSEVPARA